MASKRKLRSNNAGLALNQAQSIDKIVHDGAPIPDELADLFASLDSTSKDITPQADIYADDEGNIVAFGFQLSQRGIDPASFQDDEDMWWNTLGWLFELEGKLSLFIGDLLVGMDIKYGVSYEAIAERFGYEVKTLYNYHHICKHVDFSLRKENLSMSHYNLVTGKSAEMQDLYLSTASEQNWSVAKLRAFIKEHETPILTQAAPTYQTAIDRIARAAKGLSAQKYNAMPTEEKQQLRQTLEDMLAKMDKWDSKQ